MSTEGVNLDGILQSVMSIASTSQETNNRSTEAMQSFVDSINNLAIAVNNLANAIGSANPQDPSRSDLHTRGQEN